MKPARLQWSEEGILKSLDFDDIYFQPGQGADESYYVFLEQNRLPDRFGNLQGRSFHIAELGFGSGLNFLLTAKLWLDRAPKNATLTFVSFEKHPIEKETLARLYALWPELKIHADDILRQYPPLIEGFHHLHFANGRIHLMLALGDVNETLKEVSGTFDAWYLDGFAPAKNPAMWEDNIFPLVAARTKPGGTLASFTAAGHVRRGLAAAGFTVRKETGYGHKRDMTVAECPGKVPAPSKRPPVTVLGAGIAGSAAAFALARKGFGVTVIDRHPSCAAEASGNPAGILYPKLTVDKSPMGAFHTHGFCYTRSLLEELRLPSWNPCGVLHMDLNAEDRARSEKLIAGNEFPMGFARLEKKGVFQEGAGHLSPPELCRRLLDHPRITKIYSKNISQLDMQDGITVIAMGNASKTFPETAWLPLQSLRGQISFVKATPQSQKITSVICHDGYIMPAVSGMHCIGATFQKEPPDEPGLRAADHAENIAKLAKNLPELGFSVGAVTGGRTGYRATTPDRLPLIGPCPDFTSFAKGDGGYIDNLYVSTGFGAHGLSGAALAGEIIACQIAGDPLPVPQSLMPYLLPERFILRDKKRGKI